MTRHSPDSGSPSSPPLAHPRAARACGLAAAFAAWIVTGCARAPSPLTPALCGSVGSPGSGVLSQGRQLRRDADGLRWLRDDDRHWALPRFAQAIEHAAATVARERPGGRLSVGDLSTQTGGGPMAPHFSHRSGMDADLLFYATTLDGAPVDSPGFVHFGADALARDEAQARWLRLDVEREWLLVRTLLADRNARIQWIFVSDVVHALLIEWARARGDSPEIIERADEVMHQPHPGGIHDDHLHVRTTCSGEEIVTGCQPVGPVRRWLSYSLPPPEDRDDDLAVALAQPLPSAPAPAPQPAAAAATPLGATRAKSRL